MSVFAYKAPKTQNTFLPGQINQFIPLQWYHVLRVDKILFGYFGFTEAHLGCCFLSAG